MLFAVLPETNCQGLFYQKKLCNGKTFPLQSLYFNILLVVIIEPLVPPAILFSKRMSAKVKKVFFFYMVFHDIPNENP